MSASFPFTHNRGITIAFFNKESLVDEEHYLTVLDERFGKKYTGYWERNNHTFYPLIEDSLFRNSFNCGIDYYAETAIFIINQVFKLNEELSCEADI